MRAIILARYCSIIVLHYRMKHKDKLGSIVQINFLAWNTMGWWMIRSLSQRCSTVCTVQPGAAPPSKNLLTLWNSPWHIIPSSHTNFIFLSLRLWWLCVMVVVVVVHYVEVVVVSLSSSITLRLLLCHHRLLCWGCCCCDVVVSSIALRLFQRCCCGWCFVIVALKLLWRLV